MDVASSPAVDMGPAAAGMESLTVSRAFDHPLEYLIAYTRTLPSRGCWPGSQLQFARGDHLIYGIGVRLNAAAMTDLTVDETLGAIEELPDGACRYRTEQKVTWPDGHVQVLCEYRFIPGSSGEASTLQFTYAYSPPSSKLVKAKKLPEFRQAMTAVAGRYLKNMSGVFAGH